MTRAAVGTVSFEVEVRNVDGAVTALGAAGPFTLVVDSPATSGGGGRGFSGGQPATSTGISYSVEVAGQAPEADLLALVNHVGVIAEIPNSLRQGTPATLDRVNVSGGS
jgi:putative redox protein